MVWYGEKEPAAGEKGLDNQPPAFSSKPKSWKFKFPAEFYKPLTKAKAPAQNDPCWSFLEQPGSSSTVPLSIIKATLFPPKQRSV